LPRCAAVLLVLSAAAHADAVLEYRLAYAAASQGSVSVQVNLPQARAAPLVLIMPRNYPGGYAQLPYDSCVSQVTAEDADGHALPVSKDADAPRWTLGASADRVAVIRYSVDVTLMEELIHDAVASSKVRKDYVGLLGYSIFGYLEGFERYGVHLHVDAPPRWPVLTTLNPGVPPAATVADADAADYEDLADSQVLMGPALQVAKLPGAIPLIMAIYSEAAVDTALEGRLAREALDGVQQYFGDVPLRQYTVQLELLRPIAGHGYGFSQEHAASGSFSLSADASLTAQSPPQERERARFNYAHHMAHSWIPKRAYGVGYRPVIWEMTPVIDTIWFNEGFGRYAAIAALADTMPAAQAKSFRDGQLANFRGVIDSAPAFIRRMPLEVLSREASFLYSADFRTGRNVFARGALMAAAMDERIRERSHGERSLRDALRWLLRWSAENQRPFRTEDLAEYFERATGVKVADVLQHWREPLEKP
jgi:predicted metalloprotease with PDZ domain